MIDTLSATRLGAAKRELNLGRTIKRAVADAVHAWRLARAKRCIVTGLSALNDHVLNDIGVPRGMIHAAASRIAEAGIKDRQA